MNEIAAEESERESKRGLDRWKEENERAREKARARVR